MSRMPDTSKQPATRPLHFVNADPSSLGAEDVGKRTRDVKSHLSGHYRRWKKQHTLEAQAAKSEERQFDESSEASTPWLRDLSGHRRVTLSPTAEQDFEISSDEAGSADELVGHNNLWATAESIAMHNVLDYGNSDPFGALPLSIDPRTSTYVQLFHEGTTVSCWPITIDPRLRHLLHFEPLMHGVLGISKIIGATYLPAHQNSTALLPESRQHYGELLRLMRIYFEQRSSPNSYLEIEMIHAAAIFSFLARDYDEFEFHLKSLKNLIDSFGGLEAIKGSQKIRFINAERLRAMFLLKKPLVPLERWTPGPWAQEGQFRPFDALYERGRATMSLPNPPILPQAPFAQRTQTLILNHRDIMAAGTVAVALLRNKSPDFDSVTQWLAFRGHALTIETAVIVSELTDLKRIQPSLDLSLLASTCLAANFAVHLVHFVINPTVGLSYIPFPTLTQNLQEVADYIRRGARLRYQDLYLWTLFVGACGELASRTWSCDPSTRGSSWCSTNFAYMIEKLCTRDIRELKNNLRQFLFPFMFESYLKVLFESRHELIRLSATDFNS